MFKVGEEVGVVKLKNAYDGHVLTVLGPRLQRVEQERKQPSGGGRSRRPPAKFKVVEALPTKDEYLKLKAKRFTTDVDSLADEARSEIEELASEVREWYDNLGENLQQSDKAQRLEEAADALEQIEVPDRPEVCGHISLVYFPSLDLSSRPKRSSEAADKLRSISEFVHEWIGDNRPEGEPEKTAMTFGEGKDQEEIEVDWSELESFADDCSNAADEVEGVEFPGMYD